MRPGFRRAAGAAVIAFGLVSLAGATTPAFAQKARDTVRIAVNDPFNLIDIYSLGHEEANGYSRAIYQELISYDEYKKQWVPALAKSFTRIDDKTLEFELRDDVKFHNGDAFDADDVKTTLDYITDPTAKILKIDQYNWIKQTEILSPHKVRLHLSKAFSTDLSALSYRVRIYDGKVLNGLQDKHDYGRNGLAIGTGAYKLVSLDRNKGAVIERFDGFTGDRTYFPAPAKRIEALFIPDSQTRIAQLLTGGIDLIRGVGPDEAQALKGKPGFAITPTPSAVLSYVTFDAIGRSSNKVMTDVRVRKAFIMAVERKLLVKEIVPGGEQAYVAKGICLPSVFGCKPTVEPYAYDPAQAKKLLAEAGYPNGLDLTLYAFEPVKYLAEAIAGEVRKVGIRASVESLTSSVYIKKRGDGELTAFVGTYPSGAQPDMSPMLDVFMSGDRDYMKDDALFKIAKDADLEFDDAKRSNIYTPAINLINEKAYIFPVSEIPMLWAHDKDLMVLRDPLSDSSPVPGDFAWTK